MNILMLTRAERAALRVKCRTLPTVQEDIAAELHPWLHFRQRMTDSKIVHVLSPRAWYMYNKVSDVITLLQEISNILAALKKVSMALEN